MRILLFLFGPQHAIICLPLVAFFSLALVLHGFDILTTATVYETSRWIGVGYGVSLLLKLMSLRRRSE